MALTGRGSSPTETLSLRALQAGVAAGVDKSGLTPPVIVAHSVAVSYWPAVLKIGGGVGWYPTRRGRAADLL